MGGYILCMMRLFKYNCNICSLLLAALITTTQHRRIIVTASSTSYNPYQYDTTVPQFTPDGRLLQVEYAANAIDQSLPLIVIPSLRLDADDRDNDNAMCCLLIALRTRGKVQERLVMLPSSSDTEKAPTAVLALSGHKR